MRFSRSRSCFQDQHIAWFGSALVSAKTFFVFFDSCSWRSHRKTVQNENRTQDHESADHEAHPLELRCHDNYQLRTLSKFFFRVAVTCRDFRTNGLASRDLEVVQRVSRRVSINKFLIRNRNSGCSRKWYRVITAHSDSLNGTCSEVVRSFHLVALVCWREGFSEISPLCNLSGRRVHRPPRGSWTTRARFIFLSMQASQPPWGSWDPIITHDVSNPSS